MFNPIQKQRTCLALFGHNAVHSRPAWHGTQPFRLLSTGPCLHECQLCISGLHWRVARDRSTSPRRGTCLLSAWWYWYRFTHNWSKFRDRRKRFSLPVIAPGQKLTLGRVKKNSCLSSPTAPIFLPDRDFFFFFFEKNWYT